MEQRDLLYNIPADRNDPGHFCGAQGELEVAWRHIELVRALTKIREDIKALSDRIEALSQIQPAPLKQIYLSTGIRTTMDTLKAFTGPATAEQIAKITGRSRPAESSHLNELFRTGIASKGKRGRHKVFTLKEEYYAKG
jgi:DNA-binding transcriptional ArsR family regulator